MVLAPSSSVVADADRAGRRSGACTSRWRPCWRSRRPTVLRAAAARGMERTARRAGGVAARGRGSLALVTTSRVRDYRSEESIWRDTAAKAPRSALVRNNLGRALAAQGRVGRGDRGVPRGPAHRPATRRHPEQAGERAGRPGPLRGGGDGVRDRAAGGPGRSQDPQQLRARAVEAGAGRGGRARARGGRSAAAGLRTRALQPGERPHPAGRVPQAIAHLEAVTALPDEDDALRGRAARDLEAARRATPAR